MGLPRVNGVPLLPYPPGTALGTISSVLTVSTTQAGTGADTTETDLWTYSLPANTLSANGKTLRVTAWGRFAANGNTKAVRIYFGGTAIGTGNLDGVTTNNAAWMIESVIARTGVSAQTIITREDRLAVSAGTRYLQTIEPTVATTSAIVVKVTGQNSSASANDIVFYGAVVEALN